MMQVFATESKFFHCITNFAVIRPLVVVTFSIFRLMLSIFASMLSFSQAFDNFQ
jgi:hypothetical protein